MDNEQEKKDDNLKGYLWHENDCIIHRKGSVTINGEKKYIANDKTYMSDTFDYIKSIKWHWEIEE